jgi:ABC-type cobalamin/Fe3+-siderophores transport system ATPase subunit
MSLTVQGVTAGYGGKMVVEDVSLTLAAGEVMCLLGANGSGKTTLFKVILRLLRPTSGSVCVNGEDIARWPQGRLARAMGYVPQIHAPPFAFTVRDVVLMARAVHLPAFASPGKKDERIADEMLGRLRLLGLAEKRYTEISGGERQLVLIARDFGRADSKPRFWQPNPRAAKHQATGKYWVGGTHDHSCSRPCFPVRFTSSVDEPRANSGD